MNKKTKLTFVALILCVLVFSFTAVSANENITDQSSDVSQVSTVEKVSVSNEIEVTSSDTSALDSNQEIQEYSKETNTIDDYKSSSDNQTSNDIKKTSVNVKSKEAPLAATITPDGTGLQDITNAINSARTGDVIDLGGLTYSGGNPVLHRGFFDNKIISIINGVIDGGNVNNVGNIFSSTTFINVTFINFKSVNPNGIENSGDCFQFFNSTLYNCKFDNCTGQMHILRFVSHWSDPSFTGSILYSNFTNCHVLYDGRLQDDGQMIHLYGNALIDHCNFINTSSNHHAGAICIDPTGGRVTNSYFENCSGWIGGAIYVHGHDHKGFYELDSALENCTFINCSATEFGGAVATNYGGLNITNCYFSGNTAQKGGAIMIGGINYPDALHGDNLHGHNIKVEDCYFYDNVADEGGAIHVSGDNDTVVNCIFDDNFAIGGKGAAIFVEGKNATVIDSQFTNHKADEGTVYINGSQATVIGSTFKDNTATHGGAGVYIQGHYSYIDDCLFENNNASRHGGAIHTLGSYATITNSEFYSNNAIPSILQNPDYGLGGAIFIEGDHNTVSNSIFDYNTARNGSAIYTKGHYFYVEDDEFIENQAWSYFLFTEAQPPESYWSEDLEVVINVTLIAGDNIINAIYNANGVGDIYFHNVTYELSDSSIFNSSYRTTTDEEIHPVKGVENSNGGKLLYQDTREDNQKIALDIIYGDNIVLSNHNLITNLYGNVLLPVTKRDLSDGQFHPGIYTVHASHPEDMLYTAIDNETTFTVLPHVDLSVTKTSDKDVYILYEPATFTIKVTGVGTNATNVTVKDILPSSFIVTNQTFIIDD